MLMELSPIANINWGVDVSKMEGSSYSRALAVVVMSVLFTMSMNLLANTTPKNTIKAMDTTAPVYVLKSFSDL